jgi:hypothetical protein
MSTSLAVFSEAGELRVEHNENGLYLYGTDGNRFGVPLPSFLCKILYLQDGLLLQCHAKQKFHHSQVLNPNTSYSKTYTYITLLLHPYADLYPLGRMDLSFWNDTNLDIVYTSQIFPILISKEKDALSVQLLRVNKALYEKEMEFIDSLNSNLRDESFAKHVASEALLMTECLGTFKDNLENVEKIDVVVPLDPKAIYICIFKAGRIRLLMMNMDNEPDFPYSSVKVSGYIDNVKSFVCMPKRYIGTLTKTAFVQHENYGQTLELFRKQAKANPSLLYVLSNDAKIMQYEGLTCILSISLSHLLPFPLSSNPTSLSLTKHISKGMHDDKFLGKYKSSIFSTALSVDFSDSTYYTISTTLEIRDSLVNSCLNALRIVLPEEVYLTFYSDLIAMIIQEREILKRGNDRLEWNSFHTLFLSIIKNSSLNNINSLKKLKFDLIDTQAPWESLLNTSYHKEYQHRYRKLFSTVSNSSFIQATDTYHYNTQSKQFISHINSILESLHLLYEDYKLDTRLIFKLKRLAEMLYRLSIMLKALKFAEHYVKDFPELEELKSEISIMDGEIDTFGLKVHDIYEWIYSILSAENDIYMPILFPRTHKVCKLLECISQREISSGPSPLAQKRSIVFYDTDINTSFLYPPFRFGLLHKDKEKIEFRTETPLENLVKVMCKIGLTEEDLLKKPVGISLPLLESIRYLRLNPPPSCNSWPKEALSILKRQDIYLNNQASSSQPKPYSFDRQQLEQQYEQILELELNRESEPEENLAQYIFPSDLRLEEVSKMLDTTQPMKMRMPENIHSDEHFENEKHNLLFKLSVRRAGATVGYGALMIGTSKASATAASSIPKINLTAELPPNYETKMTMPQAELDSREKEFLMWPKFHIGVAEGLKMLSENPNDYIKNRQWITYHCGEGELYENAGFIFALGLMGHLVALHDLDIFRYLRAEQETIIIAIYLGTAASAIGTMDDKIMRVLRISIAFLIPPFVDMDIKLTQEAASMIGFGLLYKGSSNRQVTEMLLVQLGRKPLTNKDIEREGLSLASGIALGMVNLATGSNTPGLEDLMIDERLIRMFQGGRRILPPKILRTGYLMNESNKCNVSREGDIVLTTITAPGALLAYTLIHLKSNNELTASKIELPDSFYALEFVTPEHTMLQVFARNMILWDSVVPSKKWIYDQIPQLLRFCFESDLASVYSKYPDHSIDFTVIANCYLYSIGGALLSLGIRYAGTADKSVATVLIEEVLNFRRFKLQVLGGPLDVTEQNKNNVERHTLFTVVSAGVLAVGLIMAGTGDVECLRLFKRVRKWLEPDAHYGYNMAVHMAIGFLFLGNGQYSFRTDEFGIACLICSVYPKFPSCAGDNRYHLQALRHFYLLACERRLIVTKDADSKSLVSVPVSIRYKDIGTIHAETPIALRPISLVDSIEIFGADNQSFIFDPRSYPRLMIYTQQSTSRHNTSPKIFFKILKNNPLYSCLWDLLQGFENLDSIDSWLLDKPDIKTLRKVHRELMPRFKVSLEGQIQSMKQFQDIAKILLIECYNEGKLEIFSTLLGMIRHVQDFSKLFGTQSLRDIKILTQLYRQGESPVISSTRIYNRANVKSLLSMHYIFKLEKYLSVYEGRI